MYFSTEKFLTHTVMIISAVVKLLQKNQNTLLIKINKYIVLVRTN